MPYVLGTDEAGYGPNLGPLVVTATAWHVMEWSPRTPSAADADELYARLAPHVTSSRPSAAHPQAVWIADSKAVYSPSEGLESLERGALALLRTANVPGDRSDALWRQFCFAPGSRQVDGSQGEQAMTLPVAAAASDISAAMAELATGCDRAQARLIAIRPRVVFPAEFNELVEAHGNKAAVLSRLSLSLVRELLAELPDEPAEIFCDKHGGRNRYAGLIQEQFDEGLLETLAEGSRMSAYRWGPPERRRQMRFEVGAERRLPVAAASMVSKYLRELAMLEFNHFWRRHVPDLKPTAGYPVDARRFKTQIAAAQQALAISDHDLWRTR